MWKLARFRRGSATSLAPNIKGSTKLPNAAGMPGMMNRKIMMAPCKVKLRLYSSAVMMVSPGVSSSVRTSMAKIPPIRNENRIAARYMTPIRLWSRVKNHERKPRSQVR